MEYIERDVHSPAINALTNIYVTRERARARINTHRSGGGEVVD